MGPVTNLLISLPVLLFSVVAHEYAHGWVAYKNGDATAYQLGRLTWNPAKHIDPVMSILLPALMAISGLPILGGAKPVPVNPRNYRNYKKGDILVSMAGITMNLLLSVAFTLAIPVVYGVGQLLPAFGNGIAVLQQMFIAGVTINLVLAAFNLLPIPPLDGSHVFKYLLPPAWALSYARLGRYGLLIIYGLLFFGGTLLLRWLLPALVINRFLIGAVRQFVLPWPFPV